MGSSLVLTWVVVAATVGYAIVAPARLRRRLAGRTASRWTDRVGLPVPSGLGPKLEAQLLAHRVGAEVGGALGVAATGLWGVTLGRSAVASSWWPVLLLSGLLVGGAAGNAATAFRMAMEPLDTRTVRIARPSVARVVDYVPKLERAAGPVIGLSPVVMLLLVVSLRADVSIAMPVLAASASLVVLALAEVGSRRVLAAPQPAESDLQLAWQDAIRAHVLRSMLAVPIAVGVYSSAAVLSTLELAALDPRGIGGVALVSALSLVLAAGIVVLAWTSSGAPHRHFRTRLWPGEGPPEARIPGEAP